MGTARAICPAREWPLERIACPSRESSRTTFCCICNKRLSLQLYAALGVTKLGRENLRENVRLSSLLIQAGAAGTEPECAGSSGAAISYRSKAVERSDTPCWSRVAVPEDGRTPLPSARRWRQHARRARSPTFATTLEDDAWTIVAG